MKIVPILAITNALALGLAIFVYVNQGDAKSPARAETGRVDPQEIAKLRTEIDDLKHALAMKGQAPEAAPDVPFTGAAPAAAQDKPPAHGGSDAPFASGSPEAGAEAGMPEADSPEMVTFRKKVRKAIELNAEEDQQNGIIERIDQLVKDSKIGPLTPAQKDGVAKIVLGSRRKGMDVWKKLRESGQTENTSREDRARLFRTEFENLRTETLRALEQVMPAQDAKTYLDATAPEQRFEGMRFGGGAPGTPVPPAPGR